jgi:hypothetical protein
MQKMKAKNLVRSAQDVTATNPPKTVDKRQQLKLIFQSDSINSEVIS